MLTANKRYHIKAEYYETRQNANVFLWWSSKNQSREIIPESCLFTSASVDAQPGINAVYRSKATWLCYTVNHKNLYAIALEWPADNILTLSIEPPAKGSIITLLGRKGDLPWKYENGKLVIDLSPVKITELPCEWAWVFKIGS